MHRRYLLLIYVEIYSSSPKRGRRQTVGRETETVFYETELYRYSTRKKREGNNGETQKSKERLIGR